MKGCRSVLLTGAGAPTKGSALAAGTQWETSMGNCRAGTELCWGCQTRSAVGEGATHYLLEPLTSREVL